MTTETLPVCSCVTVRHEHGTRNMYSYHRCTCDPCRAASRAHRSKARGAGIEWVDAAPARERLELLINAGLTMAAIADLCAADLSQIYALRNGRRGKPVRKVQAITLNSLLAIKTRDVLAYELPAAAKVKGDAARQQLQDLHCLGWSVEAIHDVSGLTRSALRGVLAGDRTTDAFRAKVAAVHVELAGQRAPRITALQVRRSDRALALAAGRGWTFLEDAA